MEVDAGVTGRTVEGIEAQGKWLLIRFSGDLILLTHMLMSGGWHIYRPGEAWKRRRDDMRILIGTGRMLAVAFAVQVAEFHSAASLRKRKGLETLGPSLREENSDKVKAAERLRSRRDHEVGVALLSQSVVAGIGNSCKSEACFGSGVNPFRRVGSLTDAEGAKLINTARKFLRANVTEDSGGEIVPYSGTTRRANPTQALRVYRRRGQPCRRCGIPVESHKQGIDARTTFWCPRCQPMQAPARGR